VIDTWTASPPRRFAHPAACPCRRTSGFPERPRNVSTSRQRIPFDFPVPSAFISASFTANRPASRSALFAPLIAFLTFVTRWVSRLFRADVTLDERISSEELRLIIEQGGEQGILEAEEEQMIHAVIELGEQRIHEVMVPRIAMVALPVGTSFDEAIETIVAAGGIASLAHAPWALDQPSVVAELVRWGLGALEVHYHGWEDERVEAMGRLADRLGLLRTGGSDYHGDTGSYAQAQASVWVPPGVGERLLGSLARR